MAALRSRYRHGGRWWGLGTTLAAAAVALLFVMTAGAAKPTQPPPPNGPFQVPTGPVGQASGFADSDGNTTETNSNSDYNPSASTTNVANQPSYDWNSLTGGTNPTYTGTPPFQKAGGTSDPTTNAGNGWLWLALTDAQKTNTDTGFAGGTKEDQNCPAVIGSSAPNKDDLKRAYFAATTLTAGSRAGHTILNLGWVRIPQNTTSPSAHIAFEFNQNSDDPTTGLPCGGNSDGLVNRKGGDLLVLYDFTGGATIPTITIARWITSGTCGVGSDSPPCWSAGTTLTGTQAEANVDTGLSHVCDTHTIPTPSGTFCDPGEVDSSDGIATLGSKYVLPFQTSDSLANPTDTPGASEFGEAGIDLTDAGIFGTGSCISFGQVNAISRTSGDSGTAAMEDLVGPGHFTLSNCSTSATTEPQSDGTGSTVGSTWTTLTHNSQTDTYSGSFTSGTWMRDKSTVSVTGTSTWTGSVDFYLCFNSSTTLTGCDSTGTNNPASTTVTHVTGANSPYNVSNSSTTATSDGYRANAVGNYCWAAEFTHSTPDGLPDATASSTECFTITSPTTIATNPWFYPQDRAVISAAAGGNLAGSVSFKLYDNSTDCTANGATGLLYSEGPVSVSGATTKTVDTTNSSYRVTASTSANLYWRVTYTSTNANQTGSSSVCVENMGATITADGTVSFS